MFCPYLNRTGLFLGFCGDSKLQTGTTELNSNNRDSLTVNCNRQEYWILRIKHIPSGPVSCKISGVPSKLLLERTYLKGTIILILVALNY